MKQHTSAESALCQCVRSVKFSLRGLAPEHCCSGVAGMVHNCAIIRPKATIGQTNLSMISLSQPMEPHLGRMIKTNWWPHVQWGCDPGLPSQFDYEGPQIVPQPHHAPASKQHTTHKHQQLSENCCSDQTVQGTMIWLRPPSDIQK